MSFTVRGLAAAALLATTAISAQAADLGYKKPGVLPALATFNPWMVRVRALGVITGNFSNAKIGGVKTPGANGTVSDSITPELDITYFFTKNIAAELILGTTHANVKGAGSVLSGTGRLGSTWVLPPTVTLQYHFTDFGAFKPYIGAGVNYTFFYGEKHGGTTLPGLYKFRIQSAPGLAAQVGFDYMLNKNWGLNVDVKKLWLQPTAKGNVASTVGAPVKTRVKLDPWLVGVGVTYKF
jgi:outer membrane protein